MNETVGLSERLSASLGVLTVGETIPQCQHTATGPVACLEHRDFVAGLNEFVGRRKSREAAARDEDSPRRAARRKLFRCLCSQNRTRSRGNKYGFKKIAPGGIPHLHD